MMIPCEEEITQRPTNPTSQFEFEKPESPICFDLAEAKTDLTETTELEISQEQELSQAENKVNSLSTSPMPSESGKYKFWLMP